MVVVEVAPVAVVLVEVTAGTEVDVVRATVTEAVVVVTVFAVVEGTRESSADVSQAASVRDKHMETMSIRRIRSATPRVLYQYRCLWA